MNLNLTQLKDNDPRGQVFDPVTCRLLERLADTTAVLRDSQLDKGADPMQQNYNVSFGDRHLGISIEDRKLLLRLSRSHSLPLSMNRFVGERLARINGLELELTDEDGAAISVVVMSLRQRVTYVLTALCIRMESHSLLFGEQPFREWAVMKDNWEGIGHSGSYPQSFIEETRESFGVFLQNFIANMVVLVNAAITEDASFALSYREIVGSMEPVVQRVLHEASNPAQASQ